MTKPSATPESPRGRRHWQAHVKAQRESGLSRAEYCRRHDLSYHALTYWSNKLRGAGRQSARLVPVPTENIPCSRSTSSSGVRVVLKGRIAIEVADRFSPGALRQVLSVLENR